MTERETPLVEAGDILSSYLTLGSVEERNAATVNAMFDRLSALVPKEFRRTPDHAYRVLVIGNGDLERMREGERLTLEPRTYGSWTGDERAGRMLIRGRLATAAEGQAVILVRKDLPPSCVIADVEAIYRELGWDIPEMECWFRYGSWERELIIRQSPELLDINIGDVIRIHHPGDLMALAPLPGEQAYDPDTDDTIIVRDLPGKQPDAADGIWHVVDGNGKAASVSWNHRVGAWDARTGPDATPGSRP